MSTDGRRRVLVVEDEGLVAMLLEGMLEDLGHELIALTGELGKGEALAAEADIDLAVIDVNLGGAPSFAIAETLQRRGIPFVFATGYGRSGLPPEWQSAPVVQKPFQERDLKRAISQAIGG